MRTLIVAPNWIGDAIMAEPLLRRLHESGRHLTVLAAAQVAPVFDFMTSVQATIPIPYRHGALDWRALRSLAASLKGRFDQAYILPNSFKSALVPWLASIPERVGYRGEMRYGLINRRLPDPPKSRPMVERYLALSASGPVQDAIPRLSSLDFGLPFEELQRGHYAVLCPGAEYGPAKRWPTAHFAELAELLHRQRPDRRIVIAGGPGDVSAAQEIIAYGKAPVINLAGKTRLAEAIQLIAGAEVVVSNDSGLMHVAAAFAVPQVAIFGSSDPRHTPPKSPRAHIIWLGLDCSPCFERECPLGHLRCLKGISANDVLRQIPLPAHP